MRVMGEVGRGLMMTKRIENVRLECFVSYWEFHARIRVRKGREVCGVGLVIYS